MGFKIVDPACTEAGIRIARIRIERGMTQSELSIQAQVSPQTVSEIESGKREASFSTMARIAEALSVPLSAIQPLALDKYSKVPSEAYSLFNQIKNLPIDQQRMMVKMFTGQIDSLQQFITRT